MVPPELLEMIKAFGAASGPLFCFLYYMERNERKDAQSELRSISKDTAVAISELKGLIGHLVTIFKPNGAS